MAKSNTTSIIFYRDDFKKQSDGKSMFDSILDSLNIHPEKGARVSEVEISVNTDFYTLKNGSGTRIL